MTIGNVNYKHTALNLSFNHNTYYLIKIVIAHNLQTTLLQRRLNHVL